MEKVLLQRLTNLKKFIPIAVLLPALYLSACTNNEQVPVAEDLRIKTMDSAALVQQAAAIEALVSPQLAEGLSLRIWGVDSMVADPISINIDDLGRLYYARTNRQKNSEFDIRGHQDWEIGSIQLQTVEDKRAFLHKVLSPEKSEENTWLPDLNGDGSHDWRDMTVQKEHIYRLEDVSGNGLADRSQLVVEDFHDEVTDVAGAVLAWDDELFVGVGPDMWRIQDRNNDGIADEKTSISHGYGVHIGFGGHGMSGATMGPDGRIYWGIGDIGFSGEGPDGTKYEYPNEGVIVRSNPDGSDFEVFAKGVRNTHEFVFDEYGNLISVDNDGDHPGEKERLVYLVDGSDTGWRINWQFGKYRDPDNNTYKVWMDEELYKPRFEGQAAYILPPIENFVSGPTGMLYNPGTALSPAWKNTFFIVEFVGNPSNSGIHAFKLKPKGAGFELGKSDMILKGVLATGIDFGPDGAMYVADWIEGWGTKDHGRVWKLDDAEGADWAERQKTQALLAEDFSDLDVDQLAVLLANPDQRVRKKAQFELVKRGKKGAGALQKSIQQREHQLARVHGIWGISQLARQDQDYAKLLLPFLKDQDPEIRAQAARWIGDVRFKEAGDALMPLLQDENSRARFFAAEALGRIAYEPAVQPIIELLEANNDEDVYIRHAGTLALARIGEAAPVVALSDHPSAALRLAGVITLRRLQHPGVAGFLNDSDEYIVTEAARAINDDLSINDALPALANVLQEPRFTNEALLRRAINANLRVGSTESMQNLINYTLDESRPLPMRVEAMQALSTWAKPSVLDRVDGRYRGEITRDPMLVKREAAAGLRQLLDHKDALLRLNAVNAIGKLGIDEGSGQLHALLENDREPEVRIAALRSLAAMEDAGMDQAIQQALSDKEKSVRVAGLDLLDQLDISEELTVSMLAEVIEKRTTEEKQAALTTLADVPAEYSQETLSELLEKMEKGKLPREIHLELHDAVERSGSPELQARLKEMTSLAPDSLLASYEGSLYGGDEALGRRIFFQHQSAQCMRCHSYDDYGGNAGPRLNGIAAKLSREELLEALIHPGKRLAPGYGVVTLELENGKTISGILHEEDDKLMALKVGNKPDTTVLREHVVERTNAPSSMPDMKYFLSKREIRDLISFLVTLEKDDMNADSQEEGEEGHGM